MKFLFDLIPLILFFAAFKLSGWNAEAAQHFRGVEADRAELAEGAGLLSLELRAERLRGVSLENRPALDLIAAYGQHADVLSAEASGLSPGQQRGTRRPWISSSSTS